MRDMERGRTYGLFKSDGFKGRRNGPVHPFSKMACPLVLEDEHIYMKYCTPYMGKQPT
jgi:hypothetical protein